MKPGDHSVHEEMPAVAKPRAGDHWESPSGLGFDVRAVDAQTITVGVDRVVRKGGIHSPQSVEVRTRVIALTDWDSFARPYKKVRKK